MEDTCSEANLTLKKSGSDTVRGSSGAHGQKVELGPSTHREKVSARLINETNPLRLVPLYYPLFSSPQLHSFRF
jgi:hypothetical protein